MFEGWDNFYLMIGPASAGLIGLLFVVVTLTAGRERSSAMRGVSLYLTPTALQFAVVMTVSAVAMAPRLGASATAGAVGLSALVGLACAIRACLGIVMPRSGAEPPHWSDLWCYGVAPAVVYLGLCASAMALGARAEWAALATGALLLIMLLLGIRNAWDLVTWIAPGRPADSGQA